MSTKGFPDRRCNGTWVIRRAVDPVAAHPERRHVVVNGRPVRPYFPSCGRIEVERADLDAVRFLDRCDPRADLGRQADVKVGDKRARIAPVEVSVALLAHRFLLAFGHSTHEPQKRHQQRGGVQWQSLPG